MACDPCKFRLRLFVSACCVIQADVRDEDYLLAEVIKGDDLIEEHQVAVLEELLVLCIQLQCGFCVLDVIVREVAHEAACKRRKVGKPRALVLFDYAS